MSRHFTEEEAVLRIGEVCEVSGRAVTILVDKNKNLSDLFYHGKILRNVSVGSFMALLIKSKVGWSLPNPPGGLS